MDRRSQLRNVAFGGAWSEQIEGNEKLTTALSAVREASSRTADEDLRDDHDLLDALWIVTETHPKGQELGEAWRKALNLPAAYARSRELSRIAELLAAGVAARL